MKKKYSFSINQREVALIWIIIVLFLFTCSEGCAAEHYRRGIVMGEYADYRLNGDECEDCGVYLGEGDGYPRKCAVCRPKSSTKRGQPGRTMMSDKCNDCGLPLEITNRDNCHRCGAPQCCRVCCESQAQTDRIKELERELLRKPCAIECQAKINNKELEAEKEALCYSLKHADSKNERLRDALDAARVELSAVFVDPSKPKQLPGQFENKADGWCVEKALNTLNEALQENDDE